MQQSLISYYLWQREKWALQAKAFFIKKRYHSTRVNRFFFVLVLVFGFAHVQRVSYLYIYLEVNKTTIVLIGNLMHSEITRCVLGRIYLHHVQFYLPSPTNGSSLYLPSKVI